MKLLFKLILSVCSFLLLVASIYLLLPLILEGLLRAQLERQGFTVLELDIGDLGSQGATLEHLRISNESYLINLNKLKANYQLTELLSGMTHSLDIEQLDVSRRGLDTSNFSFPEPKFLSGLLKLARIETLPARQLRISQFTLYDEDRSRILNAQGEIVRLETQLHGEFSLFDRQQLEYRIKLNTTREQGIDMQILSPDNIDVMPLSIRLDTLQDEAGLSGRVNMDLRVLSDLFGISWVQSGEMESTLFYSKTDEKDTTRLVIQAEAQNLAFTETSIRHLSLALDTRILAEQDGFQLKFVDPSSLQARALQYGNNRVESLSLTFPGSMRVPARGGLIIEPQAQAILILDKLALEGIDIPHAQVEDLLIKLEGGQQEQRACGFSMQMTLPHAQIDSVSASFSPVKLQGACDLNAGLRWWMNMEVGKLAYEDESIRVTLSDCRNSLGNMHKGKHVDEDHLELEGALRCNATSLGSELRSDYRLNPLNGVGRASFSLPDISPRESAPLFTGIVKDWQNVYEIIAGKLSVDGVYRWWKNSKAQNQDRLRVDLNLQDVGGYYENVLFSGLTHEGSYELIPDVKSAAAAAVTIDSIDAGMLINHSSLKLRLDSSTKGALPVLLIDDLQLPLFNGTLQGRDIRIDLNEEEHDILLYVTGLELPQIVEMQQVEGLLATGKLDGQIPVKITSRGANVKDGKISAREPGGRIQYKSSDSEVISETAPGSEILLKILEDLQYDSLEIDLDYREDGEMEMFLAIKGLSPQVDSQRPVHFNLSLEQNLLKLLQQLRYATGISDNIDRNVREYFSSQTGKTE